MRKSLAPLLTFGVCSLTVVAFVVAFTSAPAIRSSSSGWSSFGANSAFAVTGPAATADTPVRSDAGDGVASPVVLSSGVVYDVGVADRLDRAVPSVLTVAESAVTVDPVPATAAPAQDSSLDVTPSVPPSPSPSPAAPPADPPSEFFTMYGSYPFALSTEAADPLTLAKRFAWDIGSVRTCGDGSFPACAGSAWGRYDPWNDPVSLNRVFDMVFAKFEAHGAVITHNRPASAPVGEGAWSSYYRFEVAGHAFHVSVGGGRSGCPAGAVCTSYAVTPA